MKYLRLMAMLVAVTITYTACGGEGRGSDDSGSASATVINIAAIPGVTPPSYGETPVTTITETDQYTGTVSWSPADSPFKKETVYTATITLAGKEGYTLTGVASNFFMVAGSTTAANPAGSGVVTAIFPATGSVPVTVIDITSIPGVTPPSFGETPVTTITETDQYTGTVSWAPADSSFKVPTVYTSTISLTAKPGYTLTGVAANFFTVEGATATNPSGSGVVTAVFPETFFSAGDTLSYIVPTNITFDLKYVPGGLSFKTRTDNRETDTGYNSVTNSYWIGETEVTYELWYAVRTWARANGYTLDGSGREGDDGIIPLTGAGASPTSAKNEPVTSINWRDAMVWCNALTEYYNANNGTDTDLDVVYYTDSTYQTPIRITTNTTSVNTNVGSEDKPYIKASANGNTDMANCTAKGFRLPTIAEWSAAARYKGSDSSNGAYEYPASSGSWWTPGGYASGATADYNDAAATGLVAVYTSSSTEVVKSLGVDSDNALDLYDMSGNVSEWNFEWHPNYGGSRRMLRGGSWGSPDSRFVQVGDWSSLFPYQSYTDIGFRFSRSAD